MGAVWNVVLRAGRRPAHVQICFPGFRRVYTEQCFSTVGLAGSWVGVASLSKFRTDAAAIVEAYRQLHSWTNIVKI